jgi:hypothetical protein
MIHQLYVLMAISVNAINNLNNMSCTWKKLL